MKLRHLFPLLAASVALPLLSAQSQTPPPPTPPPAADGQKPPRPPGDPAERGQKRLEVMTKNLGLSSEQSEKIAAIQKEQFPAFKALKDDNSLSKEQKHEKMKALRKATDDQISEVLTADQKTKWAEQKAQMKPQHGKDGEQPKPAPAN